MQTTAIMQKRLAGSREGNSRAQHQAETRLTNQLDKKSLRAWADNQETAILRTIARKMVDHVHLVSEDAYLDRLRMMVNAFHDLTDNKPYVILLAENEPDAVGHDQETAALMIKPMASSNKALGLLLGQYPSSIEYDNWVVRKAIQDVGLRKPEAIVGRSTIAQYLKARPDLKHVLLMNDFGCSAANQQHVLDGLRQRLSRMDFMLHIGIPYMTQEAECYFRAQNDFTLNVLAQEIVLPLFYCLTAQEQQYIEKLGLISSSTNVVASYFMHRPEYSLDEFTPIRSQKNLVVTSMLSCSMFYAFMEERGIDPNYHLSNEQQKAFDEYVLQRTITP